MCQRLRDLWPRRLQLKLQQNVGVVFGLAWSGAQEMLLPEKENRYASELRK